VRTPSAIAVGLLLSLVVACVAAATVEESTPDAASDAAAGESAADSEGAAVEAPALLYRDDRLTANVSRMSMHALLSEIGRQSGARIRMEGVADRDVSVRVTGMPLPEALRRILGEENFTLIYGRALPASGEPGGAGLREIQVFGDGGTGVTTQRLTAAPPPAPTAAAGQAEANTAIAGGVMAQLSRVLEKHGDVQLPAGSSLAASLGSEQASFHQLISVAMRDGDRTLRQEAAGVLAGVFDSDPDARALLAAPGDAALDPEVIASFVRASGGPHAEEFLGDIAQHLRTPALRAKVNQIRARLQGAQ
jgi:hypothetical protein